MKKIAVIGAGLAGLSCANVLSEAGHDVQIFEKSRGVGGRMSTRWIDRSSEPPVGFDHGSQYIQARSQAFQRFLQQAQAAGAAQPWKGRFVNLAYGVESDANTTPADRWVGTPGMASLLKFLARPLSVTATARVQEIVPKAQSYSLKITKSDGTQSVQSGFDAVIIAAPAEQADVLAQSVDAALAKMAAQVRSECNWSVMLGFGSRLPVNYDAAFVADSPIGWVCRDSAKPGRASGERWVLQANSDWSGTHTEFPPAVVAEMLLDVFASLIGKPLEPTHMTAHRWLYGVPVNSFESGFYLNSDSKIGACGDWLNGSSAEGAYLSGEALGAALLKAL